MERNEENEIIDFLVEVDPEKRVVYVSDYNSKKNTKCISKRYRNKRDIYRIVCNYIKYKINIDTQDYRKK